MQIIPQAQVHSQKESKHLRLWAQVHANRGGRGTTPGVGARECGRVQVCTESRFWLASPPYPRSQFYKQQHTFPPRILMLNQRRREECGSGLQWLPQVPVDHVQRKSCIFWFLGPLCILMKPEGTQSLKTRFPSMPCVFLRDLGSVTC